jgi:hypothetical protein
MLKKSGGRRRDRPGPRPRLDTRLERPRSSRIASPESPWTQDPMPRLVTPPAGRPPRCCCPRDRGRTPRSSSRGSPRERPGRRCRFLPLRARLCSTHPPLRGHMRSDVAAHTVTFLRDWRRLNRRPGGDERRRSAQRRALGRSKCGRGAKAGPGSASGYLALTAAAMLTLSSVFTRGRTRMRH